jgi:anti-sigma-K factor RskA
MNTPEDDDLNVLAGEYFLGLLGAEEMARAAARRRRDPVFDAAVRAWEAKLMPLADELPEVRPPESVWAGIEAAVAPKARGGLWDNLGFWRVFGLGAGGFGLAAAALAVFLLHAPAPVPVATALLASQNDGTFIATAERSGAGVELVVSPSLVSVPAQSSAELWLLLPGAKPQALGLLASGHPVVLALGNGALGQAELAVSIEPLGGSPTGAPTGPVIAAAKFIGI